MGEMTQTIEGMGRRRLRSFKFAFCQSLRCVHTLGSVYLNPEGDSEAESYETLQELHWEHKDRSHTELVLM